MKRSAELTRKTPLRAKKPMARSRAPKITANRKPKARPGHDKKMLQACKGERCFLAIPGVCRGDVATVVPAHRNEGKGMGLKVPDVFTVPACFHCHTEYDQGVLFTREEKRAIWNAAYAEWQPVREMKLNAVSAAYSRQTNARVVGAATPQRAYGNQER